MKKKMMSSKQRVWLLKKSGGHLCVVDREQLKTFGDILLFWFTASRKPYCNVSTSSLKMIVSEMINYA